MGRIAVHEFITLDGVIENPRWSFAYPFDPKMGEAIGTIAGSSQAILLGRQTYEEFFPAWSTRTAEDDPGAPFFNESPKYVVSGSLQSADWNNSAVARASACSRPAARRSSSSCSAPNPSPAALST